MSRSILVLGGSGFVGRAVVADVLARGWEVTTFNRGRDWHPPEVRRLIGDRLDPASPSVLSAGAWDVAVEHQLRRVGACRSRGCRRTSAFRNNDRPEGTWASHSHCDEGITRAGGVGRALGHECTRQRQRDRAIAIA